MLGKSFPTSPFDGFLPPDPGASGTVESPRPKKDRIELDEEDLKTILRCLELALTVCTARDGNLSAHAVSLKTMLTVIRGEVLNQLVEQRAGAAAPTAPTGQAGN